MHIGKYTKTSTEEKRYTIDYEEWLDTGETISTVTIAVTPATGTPVVCDQITYNGALQTATFFASAGVDGTNYTATATMTSSAGQVKQSTILFIVRD